MDILFYTTVSIAGIALIALSLHFADYLLGVVMRNQHTTLLFLSALIAAAIVAAICYACWATFGPWSLLLLLAIPSQIGLVYLAAIKQNQPRSCARRTA